MGTLYRGDCLDVMEQKIAADSVDLIYLDPPFFSNKKYEKIWGDEAEVRSFEDRWAGGVEVYSQWMAERLRACHRVLKPTGSLFLHCDWHASHHLRLRLDEIFGRANFVNEIIWHYKKWSAGDGLFQRNHDNIFFYVKSNAKGRAFNTEFMPRAASTQRRFGDQEIISGFDAEGNRVPSKTSKKKSEGVALDDVWDIGRVAPVKQLYPTEKPEALLRRIITVASNPGQLVLDPFCGCGTAVVVAEQLGRKWIGIDVSPTAINVIRRRLRVAPGEVEVVGLPTTVRELQDLEAWEFQNWVVRDRFNGTTGRKGGDKGIDGLTFMVHEPIQVKQSEGIGRNVVDNFQAAMRRVKKRRGYIVAFSFGRGAYEEAAAVRRREGLEVILLTVEDLLRGPPSGTPMSSEERPKGPAVAKTTGDAASQGRAEAVAGTPSKLRRRR